MADSQKDSGIRIKEIFLTRAQFEHSPAAMKGEATPAETDEHQVTITLSAAQSPRGETGLLTITVQTTPDNPGHYRFLVEMMLVVNVEPGHENMTVAEYVTGPAGPTLYPFLREAVAGITGRGRFGPVYLKPINFAQLADGTPAAQASQ